MSIPQDTIIYGPASWNGQIDLPIVKAVSTETVTADSGYTTTTNAVIELGFGDLQLNFSKAVRILIPGMAGKSAAYSRGGATPTKITTNCTADTQFAGDSLAAAAECKIDAGSDLVIWTKHFTQFIAYTQTVSPTSYSSSPYNTVTATPTVAPTATVTPSTVPTAIPSVPGTPIQPSVTPIPGTSATPVPTVTATIQPGIPFIGTTQGVDMLWIVIGVVALIAVAAYVFMQKK
jgi:hypothetical protein